ncbi:3-deoxy-D-manno-octulosonic-acid transferase [Pedobacter sp. CAN_A7]|uniref:3-deoxy-D-manno-octulosonic acid transferase n=1 Tax=Pedobacter sp. CAN_A7 TaxID=2787722 RepID=UPI0018CAD7BF
MLCLYNIGIFFYSLLVRVFSPFNAKAKLFIQGRQDLFSLVEEKINANEKHIWFHFASLGEFEQGRPVLEKLKQAYPAKKMVVTFFSPSGYEIRKNYPVEGVFYLPLDTAANARRFIDLINPEIAIFTKYEFWYHYFHALKKKNIPLFLISGIFRPSQPFFKWYGSFNRSMLRCVTHFFVQNEESKRLLLDINVNQVSLSGDTRFDRVAENTSAIQSLPLVASFVGTSPVVVAGSTWPQDEALLATLALEHPNWKMILAPHEIGNSHINQISSLFPKAIKFSGMQNNPQQEAQVLIIDNIGMLSALYQYGDIAYIGGGFGAGIHNTLEAAAFGIPVIFGPRYEKFQEAKDLVELGAARSIKNNEGLENAFQTFSQHKIHGEKARTYVMQKTGATAGILHEITRYIS